MAYYVYLLASDKYGTRYLGVTNDIVHRVYEHKSKVVADFTKRYAVDKLVWFEIYDDPTTAIAGLGTLRRPGMTAMGKVIHEMQNPAAMPGFLFVLIPPARADAPFNTAWPTHPRRR